MPQNAPTPRLDAEWGDEVEFFVTREVVNRLAELVNAEVKAGRIYGQIVLPPDEAQMKLRAQRNGGSNGQSI